VWGALPADLSAGIYASMPQMLRVSGYHAEVTAAVRCVPAICIVPCERAMAKTRRSSATIHTPRKKGQLPTRDCAACGRPFEWRKKWAATWETVRYCSARCRRQARHTPSLERHQEGKERGDHGA
jgi:hypothetical protein